MPSKGNIVDAFFALLRAGLWEQSVRLLPFSQIDLEALYKLAEEQSVVGLIAAGIEHVEDMTLTKQHVMPFMKQIISLEHRNASMNILIASLVSQLKQAGIESVLVKGQGIAQCYARPLWRAAGDIDFFFDEDNYEQAKVLLTSMASSIDPEEKRKKHQAMVIDSLDVELHGLMPTEVSNRVNLVVSIVQRDIFENDGTRIWNNNGTPLKLPNPDNDAIIIFPHFIQHFFVGGVGLRQICDWCRLLWTYRDEIDQSLLASRLNDMGLLSEWKAFAYFAVSYLGMPIESMPFYSTSAARSRKSRRICRIILESGNFGHKKDQSYRHKYSKLVEKSITFFRRFGEFASLTMIFPVDGPRFFFTYVWKRTKAVF